MITSALSRLVTLVLFELDHLEKSLSRLRAASYPSKVAEELIDAFARLVRDQRQDVTAILEDAEDDPQGAVERMQSEHRKLVDKLRYVEFVANARTEEVPWSVIPSVERVSKLLFPDRKVLTTAANDLNYSIRWSRSKPIGLSEFFTLSIPKIHRINFFLHVVIAHELFHPLLETFLDEETKAVLPRIKDGCAPLVRTSADDLFFSTRLDRLINDIHVVWRRGLEELMCDLGCIFVFGPAGLLSLSSIAIAHNLDERPSSEGKWYPPWRFRLRQGIKWAIDDVDANQSFNRLQHILSENDLAEDRDRLQKAVGTLRDLTVDEPDARHINAVSVTRIAYEQITLSLPNASAYVKTRIAVLPDRWGGAIEQVPDLLRSLDQLVPPGETFEEGYNIDKPAPLTAIALAGWLFQLRAEATKQPLSDLVSNYNRLCRLLLKAFEDSELKRYIATRNGAIS